MTDRSHIIKEVLKVSIYDLIESEYKESEYKYEKILK